MTETVKVELEVPKNIYKAIEFICTIEPKQDIKEYMIWCLDRDADSMTLGAWDKHVNYLNEHIQALLKGEDPK